MTVTVGYSSVPPMTGSAYVVSSHQTEAAGYAEIRAGVHGRQQRLEQLRRPRHLAAAGGHRTFDEQLARRGEPDHVRRRDAGRLSSCHLEHELADDRDGVHRPQSDTGRRQIS